MTISTDNCLLMSMEGTNGLIPNKTLQIAVYTDGQSYNGIRSGIRLMPVDKLIIIHEEVWGKASQPLQVSFKEFVKQISSALAVEVEEIKLKSGDLNEVLEAVRYIHNNNFSEYNDILLNVTDGGKILSCTSISSAFIFGIRTFWIDQSGIHMLPILKLGYQKILSESKLAILNALSRAHGSVKSLEALSDLTGLDKSLISRHINGSEDSQGLVDLGLVSANRQSRGRLEIEITALGKIVII